MPNALYQVVQPAKIFFRDIWASRKFISAILIFLLVYSLISAAFFHWIEKKPYFDSLYFTVINITTVGFGDIHPCKNGGKCLAMLNSIIGLILFGSLVAVVSIALQPDAKVITNDISNSSEHSEFDGINQLYSAVAQFINKYELMNNHHVSEKGDNFLEVSINIDSPHKEKGRHKAAMHIMVLVDNSRD